MRNTLIGAILAIVLVAGLFAASRYGSRPAVGPEPPKDPAKIAAAIDPDFIGQTRIGDWQFACTKPHMLPQRPQGSQVGNSAGTPPKHPPPPPNWRIPRCTVAVGLRNPRDPEETMRVNFRLMGFQRVLASVMRLPPSIAETGDTVIVRLDHHDLQVPVRACGAFCFAAMSIKPQEEPFLMSTKHVEIIIKPAASPQPIKIKLGAEGLAPAIKAMRRIDK